MKILQTLFKALISFMQVQLFISLVSLPVLIAWGLPISIMSVIGNLIFSPLIGLFLLFASLIFFSELLSIPNSGLIYILEYITKIWIYCLSFGSKTWLIGIKENVLPLAMIIMLFIVLALMHKKTVSKKIFININVLCILIITACHCFNTSNRSETIQCMKKNITLSYKDGAVYIKDHGGLGEKRNPESWILYTFIPTIIKKYGTLHIASIQTSDKKVATQKAIAVLKKECIFNDSHK